MRTRFSVVPAHVLQEKLGKSPDTHVHLLPSQPHSGQKGAIAWTHMPLSSSDIMREPELCALLPFFFFTLTMTHTMNSLDQHRPIELSAMMEMFFSLQYGSQEPHVATEHWNCDCSE